HYGLDRPVEPAIYLPYSQKPFDWMSWITLMVRTEAEPAALAPVVRRTVWALDDRLPIRRVSAVAELYGESHARRRFAMILVGAFAVLALGLVVIGIYGVVAYTVARQRKEIGVRLALGARRRAVAAAVVRRGLLIALGGVLIGGPAALGLTRLMSGLLYGIAPTDPVTFGGVALVLAGVAALASYVPARRATRTDPMTVLREE
ncbi:MAG: FtsX-like permease family protein, partial [Gemmatimonadota bacterium]